MNKTIVGQYCLRSNPICRASLFVCVCVWGESLALKSSSVPLQQRTCLLRKRHDSLGTDGVTNLRWIPLHCVPER